MCVPYNGRFAYDTVLVLLECKYIPTLNCSGKGQYACMPRQCHTVWQVIFEAFYFSGFLKDHKIFLVSEQPCLQTHENYQFFKYQDRNITHYTIL